MHDRKRHRWTFYLEEHFIAIDSNRDSFCFRSVQDVAGAELAPKFRQQRLLFIGSGFDGAPWYQYVEILRN